MPARPPRADFSIIFAELVLKITEIGMLTKKRRFLTHNNL